MPDWLTPGPSALSVDPVFDLNIAGDALADHDYSDGVSHLGLTLAFNAAHYTGTNGVAAIQDNGSGVQVLRLTTDDGGGRYDNTGQTAGVFQIDQVLAEDLKSVITSCIVRLDFQGATGMDISGNDEAVFMGVADNPTAMPGTAAGTVAAYSWLGNTVATPSREVNSMAATVRTNKGTAASFGGTGNQWAQWRFGQAGLERMHVNFRAVGGTYADTSGAGGATSDVFTNSHDSGIKAFFGLHDINGASPTVDVARIRVFLFPGLVS